MDFRIKPGNGEDLKAEPTSRVMRGLDPRIYLLRKTCPCPAQQHASGVPPANRVADL
jgi:hypothetical protein